MKSVTIFYNISVDDEVMEIMRKAGASEYSKVPRTHGKGRNAGFRTDDHIWPGFNAIIVTVADDEVAARLLDALQEFRDSGTGRRAGCYAYSAPVDRALR